MINLHNIETRKFPGKNYYVGYGAGFTWHIHNVKGLSKPGVNWRANVSSINGPTSLPFLYGKTLADISQALDNPMLGKMPA